ncbi:hypothetical protein B5X24_HaOG214117 [Helicoverpa armigera]|nr:hypothetical protein B5X24_HaOG214117 [Helicoverpa armigera]
MIIFLKDSTNLRVFSPITVVNVQVDPPAISPRAYPRRGDVLSLREFFKRKSKLGIFIMCPDSLALGTVFI